MSKKHLKYNEGQWFAIPLRNGGFAIGIVVRGSYKTKGGLGYFFGPKYEEIPGDEETLEKDPQESTLIAQFGDLGIITGSWPLIKSSRSFTKEDWPIPKFGSPNPLVPQKAFIREYKQNNSGSLVLIRETVVDAKEIAGMPIDSLMGGGSIEIRLTNLLEKA
jgi:hypothetical protein